MKVRLLSREDVKNNVNMAQVIDAVEEAYIQLSTGKAILPMRIQIPAEKGDGISLFMPAYLSSSRALGAKIVSVFPENPGKNLPTIHALVFVLDDETGCPETIIEGTYLTALRTGAASGVATRWLAKKDAETAAIFGAGIQGRTQLEAVCAVRPLKKVWIFDTNTAAAETFSKEMKEYFGKTPEITAAGSQEEALKEADIVCTATTSTEPVFNNGCLKPGVHINGIGSYTPEMQEIPHETVIRSRVVVDSKSAALEEAGDLIIPIRKGLFNESQIHGEIGLIAAGQITGRESDEDITFFKSVGLAVQDMAVAALILQKAREQNLGIEVEL